MSKNSEHNVKIVWDDPSKEGITYPKRDFNALNRRVKRRKMFIRVALGTFLILTVMGILTFISLTKKTETTTETLVSDPYGGPTLTRESFDLTMIDSIASMKASEKQIAIDSALLMATKPVHEQIVHLQKEEEDGGRPTIIVATDTLHFTQEGISENEPEISDSVHQAVNKSFVPSEFVRAYPIVGYDSLYQYLTEYINKELFGSKNVSDTLRISFAIEVDGRPSGIRLSINTSDSIFMKIEEAVQNMPAWKPATADGQPIMTQFRLPMIIQSKTIKED